MVSLRRSHGDYYYMYHQYQVNTPNNKKLIFFFTVTLKPSESVFEAIVFCRKLVRIVLRFVMYFAWFKNCILYSSHRLSILKSIQNIFEATR